jgi:hypothetical protein
LKTTSLSGIDIQGRLELGVQHIEQPVLRRTSVTGEEDGGSENGEGW